MEVIFDTSWTAQQMMETYPQTISVFLAMKMDCVGCYLEQFCSLQQVAESYQLQLDFLCDKLRASIE